MTPIYGHDWPDVNDPGPEGNPTLTPIQFAASRMVDGDVFILDVDSSWR